MKKYDRSKGDLGMAFKRNALKAMGLTEEQVESTMEMHLEVVDKIKSDLKEAKEKAEKYDSVKQELDDLKLKSDDGWKEKYEKEHKAFEDFKSEQTAKELFTKQSSIFKEILKEANIAEKYIPTVIKASADVIKNIEIGEDGGVINKEILVTNAKADWEMFVESVHTEGADPPEPPNHGEDGSFESLSLSDKMMYANQHPNDPQVQSWLSQ